MKFAVLTAYSPTFKRIAQLCTPSQKSFASRAGGEFFELPLPDDGKHQWRKMWLIQDWLTNWHGVFWFDADCIVPQDYELPYMWPSQKVFLPWTSAGPLTFASFWLNSAETFQLLNKIFDLHRLQPDLSLFDAQRLAIGRETERVGHLDRGLVHYDKADRWEKQQKLRQETMA